MSRVRPCERVLYAATTGSIPVPQRLAAAREAGFTAISLFTTDVDAAAAQGISPAEIGQLIDESSLSLATLEIVSNWVEGQDAACSRLPPDMAQMLLRRNVTDIARMAQELGARSVTVADLFDLPFDGPVVARAFARVCDVAADHGLDVVLEFVPMGCVATVAQAREVLERADCANAGMLIDSWHFFRGGSSLKDMAAVPPELIASWQMNDASLAPAHPKIFNDMVTRKMPGEGEFNLAGLMQAIAATGTNASGGIEVFGEVRSGWSAGQIARRAAEALDYCIEISGDSY